MIPTGPMGLSGDRPSDDEIDAHIHAQLAHVLRQQDFSKLEHRIVGMLPAHAHPYQLGEHIMTDKERTSAAPATTKLVVNDNTWLYTCLTMENYGGGFARHIARAALVADMSNRTRMLEAFPDLFNKYGPGSDFYQRMSPNAE